MTSTSKMKYYSILLMFAAIIVCCGLASCRSNDSGSQDGWKYIGDVRDESGQYVSVYIDLDGMIIEDKIRKFWIRYYATKNGSEEKYIRQIGFWEVDCNSGDLFVLGEEYYGTDGKLLGRSEERIKEEYEDDSLGDKLSSSACRYAGRN